MHLNINYLGSLLTIRFIYKVVLLSKKDFSNKYNYCLLTVLSRNRIKQVNAIKNNKISLCKWRY